MGSYVITVDTGTTNTRTFLWDENRRMAASSSAAVGVRNTAIDGNNGQLKGAVRDCLNDLLAQAGITYDDVEKVIACGMITSNVGLAEIPHVPAPAGLRELAGHMRPILLEDVCPLPILFVPGVKNSLSKVTPDNFEAMDIMRGEEAEIMAILDRFPKNTPYLIVLSGSHTKFAAIDGDGRITGCLTTIAGELLAAVTNDTVIADSVGRRFVSEEDYDREMALKGFDTSARVGMGRACFLARILHLFTEKGEKDLESYLLGVTLAGDVQSLMMSCALHIEPGMTVIVSGKSPLRGAVADILRHDGYFTHVKEFVPDPGFPLSAAGAYLIAHAI